MTDASIDITEEVLRERSTLRPIHPWFAVRPPSLGRAAAVLTLLRSADSYHELVDGRGDMRRLAELAGLEDDEQPSVLDLFAGTSSIAGAAAGLGCEADSVELNPVAYFAGVCAWALPKTHGEPRPSERPAWRGLTEELTAWSKSVWDAASRQVADAFNADAAGYVWSTTAPCISCGTAVDVVNPAGVAPAVSSNPATRDAPSPLADRPCPLCSTSLSVGYLREYANAELLVAITDARGTPLGAIDMDRELGRVERTGELIAQMRARLTAPPPRTIDPQLGSERQGAVLLALADAIASSEERLIRTGASEGEVKALVSCLGLALSAVSVLARRDGRFGPTGRFQHGGPHGARRRFAYVEPGLGVWAERWHRQIAVMAAQFDRAQSTSGVVRPHLGDAARLPFPDESFDAVICDPPYFDNVQFGEESERFYGWLRLVARSSCPELFEQERTPRAEEVVAHQVASDRGRERYESLLRASVQEAIRVLRSDRCLSFIYTARDPKQLDDFLRRAQPEGLELVDAVKVASAEREHIAGTEPWISYVLLLRKSRPLSAVPEPTVDADRVLELAEKGRSKLYAAVADLLQSEWDDEDVAANIPPNFAGSTSQKIRELVAGHADLASLLAELGPRALRRHGEELGLPPEFRRADATGLAESILRWVGFTVPSRPDFTVSGDRAETARCSVELGLAGDVDDIRGRFLTGASAVERIVRHATIGWLQAFGESAWTQLLEGLFSAVRDKRYAGPGAFSFGDWTAVFAALPRLQDGASPTFHHRLAGLKRALGKRGAEKDLNRVVQVRNLVEHDKDGFLSKPTPELRTITATALNDGVRAINLLAEAGALPRVLQPLDERRDRYDRLTLRTLDEQNAKVELFVDAPTDLTRPYLWFPGGSNPREVEPVLLPLDEVREGIGRRE